MAQMASGLAAMVELASNAFTLLPPISGADNGSIFVTIRNRAPAAGVRRSLRRPGRFEPSGDRGAPGLGRPHRAGDRGFPADQPAGGFPSPSTAQERRPRGRRAERDATDLPAASR